MSKPLLHRTVSRSHRKDVERWVKKAAVVSCPFMVAIVYLIERSDPIL